MSIGSKIRKLRTKRGLSLEELAESLNGKFGLSINKGMISKWENDITDPKLETVRYLALFFNVSLDELLGINKDVNTIAAHFEGENFTEEEMEEIINYIEYIKTKRKDK